MKPSTSSRPPVSTRGSENDQRLRLAAMIRGRREEIVRQWAASVREDVIRRHVTETDLRDAIDDYLPGLADGLGKAEPSYDAGG